MSVSSTPLFIITDNDKLFDMFVSSAQHQETENRIFEMTTCRPWNMVWRWVFGHLPATTTVEPLLPCSQFRIIKLESLQEITAQRTEFGPWEHALVVIDATTTEDKYQSMLAELQCFAPTDLFVTALVAHKKQVKEARATLFKHGDLPMWLDFTAVVNNTQFPLKVLQSLTLKQSLSLSGFLF